MTKAIKGDFLRKLYRREIEGKWVAEADSEEVGGKRNPKWQRRLDG